MCVKSAKRKPNIITDSLRKIYEYDTKKHFSKLVRCKCPEKPQYYTIIYLLAGKYAVILT